MTTTGSIEATSRLQPLSMGAPLCLRFGAKLRELRQARGYTQVELADYLGIDRSFISDLERGKKNISIGYLETIAQGFKLSISDLLRDL